MESLTTFSLPMASPQRQTRTSYPLGVWSGVVIPIQLDVLVGRFGFLGNLCPDAFVCGDHHSGSAVQLESLCEDQTRWSCSDNRCNNADRGAEFIHKPQFCFFIREIVYLQ